MNMTYSEYSIVQMVRLHRAKAKKKPAHQRCHSDHLVQPRAVGMHEHAEYLQASRHELHILFNPYKIMLLEHSKLVRMKPIKHNKHEIDNAQ